MRDVVLSIIIIIMVPVWVCAMPNSPTVAPSPAAEKNVTIPESKYKSLIQAQERLKAIDGAITDKLEASKSYWTTLSWAVGLIYGFALIIAGLAAWIGPRLMRQLVSEELRTTREQLKTAVQTSIQGMENRVTNKIEELEQRFEELEQRFKGMRDGLIITRHKSLAEIHESLAMLHFYDDEYEAAIDAITEAINFTERFKDSEDPRTQRYVKNLEASRAYYLARLGKDEDRLSAMNALDIILSLAQETGNIDYIDSYIFILKRYGQTQEEKRKWMEIYQNYREPLNASLRADLKFAHFEQEYQEYYERVKRDIQNSS